ncbi:MAG TPA: hypothetical protein VMM13_16665 [Euzebya sp.]|nr:hypothetical protein [Euzebya sp.]
MDDPWDPADTTILAEVEELYARLDPPPAGLEDQLKLALTVHALHAELAELTAVPLAEATRSDAAARTDTVTFTSGTLSLMVSLSDLTDTTATVDGWVTRGGARVELQVANMVRTATADAHGRFVMRAVPRGRAHFIMWPNPDRPDDRPVVTPTIDL